MTVSLVIASLLGVLTWSFLEYVIHRWLGHDRRFVRRNRFGAEHTAHHSKVDYFAAWWKKAAAGTAVFAIVGPLSVLIAGMAPGLTFTISFVAFYLVYELVHRLLHLWGGVGPYSRWARRHHFFHHFHDPTKNHGVTSPLWDIVFGTLHVPAAIVVPEKLAMRWLVDTTGAVRAPYAADYAIRRLRAGGHPIAPANLSTGF